MKQGICCLLSVLCLYCQTATAQAVGGRTDVPPQRSQQSRSTQNDSHTASDGKRGGAVQEGNPAAPVVNQTQACRTLPALYVDSSVAGSGNGGSWLTAYKELSEALEVAMECPNITTIYVARGTYRPTSNKNPDSAFTILRGGLKMFGGYPSGGEGPRNIASNPTVLSGELGTQDGIPYSSYHVMVIAGLGSSADSLVVDGFTITKGYATGGSDKKLYNGVAIPRNAGSGLYLGGNSGAGKKVAVRNCIFTANYAPYAGGGMVNDKSSPAVTNCIFSANVCDGMGGGMANISSSAPAITNCIFSTNAATGTGGAVYNESSSPVITNCTISANTANINGAGMYNQSSSPAITNCIIWGNSNGNTNGIAGNSMSTPSVSYSDVQDGYAGTGNINADPLFANPADPDGADNHFGTPDDGLRLQGPSPAINKGSNAAVPPGITTDVAGAARIQGGIVDMGAYESPYSPLLLSINDASKAEGNSGITTFTFTVRLSAPSPAGGVSFTIATADSTATAPSDYTARSVSAAIPAGDSTYSFDVSVNGDLAIEPTEYFLVKVSNVSGPGAVVTDSTATGTIVNDDACPSSATLYVDSSRSVSGDGRTWGLAYKELRDALFVAAQCPNVTTINVARGTYKPTADNNRDSAFAILRGGLKLYGGYPSGGIGSRNATANPTILSGDIGTQNDNSDNSYHAFVITGLSNTADSVIVDGFTITKANANATGSKQYNGVKVVSNEGAGMYLHSNNGAAGKIAIRNCIFTANSTATYGGGLYNQLSSPTITNCTFSSNTTTTPGSFGGAGMFNFNLSSPSVTNCLFLSNNSAYNGGGMLNANRSLPALTGCVFSSNQSQSSGGGISMNDVDGAAPTADSARITNCLFTNNSANNGGGINLSAPFRTVITNCTFNGNTATGAGGGIYKASSTESRIANSIFAANNSITILTSGTLSVSYSDIQQQTGTLYPGTGNINADPLFANPADPDGADNLFGTPDDGLKLQGPSPAINKGSNAAVPPGITTDITGAARIQDGIVDMGAYEFTPINLSINDVSKAEGNSGITTFTFTVRLSAPALQGGVSFNIATADSTATAPGDYTDRSLRATIAAGDSTYSFDVSVNGDVLLEPTEYFLVKISGVTGLNIIVSDNTGLGTIVNDDACPAATLYVDSSKSVSGDGSSWATAYKELRDALAVASQCPNVTTILVARGTYKPTNNTDRDSAFAILRGGVKLYGGYPSGGGTRNIAANPTVLSGDIGTQNDNSDNSYHAFVITGLSNTADSVIVDGFTITKANANATGSKQYNGVKVVSNEGAGMYLHSNNGAAGKIAIRNCIFTANSTATYGGGLYNQLSSPTITNCTFSSNTTTTPGSFGGAGMFNFNLSSPSVTNCLFLSNNSAYNGGGMLNANRSLPALTGCVFSSNQSQSSGGGISMNDVDGAAPTADSARITNCLFTNNSANNGGGINLSAPFRTVITNCTFNGNTATGAGGGIYKASSTESRIVNSIIWGNSSSIAATSGTVGVTYSDVQQGTSVYPGTGNINADPLFVNPADPNGTDNIFATSDDGLRLQQTSPAVNRGSNAAVPPGITTDITGAARIQGGIVDVGAYESPYSPLLLSINDVSKAEGNSGTTTFTFTVRLSNPALAGGVSFNIATADSTATAPSDYTARSVSATISAGDSTYSFDVSVNGDLAIEPAEYFLVKVTNVSGSGVIVTDSTATGTIISDDACASSATLYVDSSRSVSGDGSSWANAYKELRDALAVASQCPNVTTILVARGTYKPTNNTDRDSAFAILRGGVKLYGGYPSGGGSRNIAANPTVLSGDIGTPNNTSDNSYHVMVIAGLGNTADSVVIDGFTITRGNADGSAEKSYNGAAIQRNGGGGMYLGANSGAGARIAVRNCIVSVNNANSGGGMYNQSSSPTISQCTFSANSVNYIGGGVYNQLASPTLTNCIFSANGASYIGGGMYNQSSFPAIINCTFSANTSSYGGGMANESSSPTLANSIIWGNSSGIEVSSSNLSVSYSDVQGAGVYPGTGNINADPLFVNPADPDGADNIFGTPDDGLRLQQASPAVNRGNNAALPAGINTDITGAARIQGNIVDMGAYESPYTTTLSLSINDVSKAEGNSGTTIFTFTVRLSAPAPAGGVSFTIATADSTATAPSDYTARSVSAAIPAGDSTYSFDVSVNGDLAIEPTEYFLVKVMDVTGFNIAVTDNTGLGTIVSDDACPSLATLYVDSSRSVSGDGSSWANAYKELREALTIAASCSQVNTILVTRGTYKPTADNNRESAFAILRGGLKVYGGYPSGGGTRNVAANPTILSGDIGNQNDSTDNSYHVFVIAGLGNTADSVVVDGITITRGNADVSGSSKSYSGVDIQSNQGGGMYLAANSGAGARIAVRNCIFTVNYASNGGGMYNQASSPAIISCTFNANNAGYGGGMYNQSSNPTITNCTFIANSASIEGGGMINISSSPVITNSAFSANTAAIIGGGMGNESSSPGIANCIFNANYAPSGVGMSNLSSSPVITNCTFIANVTASDGEIIYNIGSSPVIANCIIWGNSGYSIRSDVSSTPSVSYSDVQGTDVYPGTGNINADPLFVNPADPDGADNIFGTADDGLKLQQASPAVNRGGNAALPAGITTDITGAARIQGGTIDMGAYESPYAPPLTLSIDDVSKAEGNAGSTIFTFTVRLSAPAPAGGVSFNIATADSTATAPGDYTARSLNATIAAGDSTYTFNVMVGADTNPEFTEYFLVKVTGISDPGIIVSKSTGLGSIITDDLCSSNTSVLYVDGSRNVSGDGSSWANAFRELREALAVADQCSQVNTILVARGTYKPTNNTDRDSAFAILRGGLKVYGGYPSGGGTRNIAANPTVLSGDIGTPNNTSDNSYHVLVIAGLGSTADSVVVDGFTITGGNASGNLTLKLYNGAAVMSMLGGGMYLSANNEAGNRVAVRNCTFSVNNAGSGGGMFNDNSSPTITSCIFSANTAQYGGGMYSNMSSSPVVTNCTFSANTAEFNGGAILNDLSSPVITNCTFSANATLSDGGILFNGSSSPVITNCIIWGNGEPGIFNDESSSATVSYSDVQGTGVYPGTGNINADPLFFNPADPDGADNLFATADDGLKLKPNSPAINKGSNAALPAGITTDITGAPRIQQGIVDMGAYESGDVAPDPCSTDQTPPVITPKNITVYLDGSGHATIRPFDVIQSVTDNCQLDSASIRISQSTFSCSDVSTSPSDTTTTPGDTTTTPTTTVSHLAYAAGTSSGVQAYGGELGMQFQVNKTITIRQLGAFDHQSNGITGTQNGGIRVAIFNRATQQIMPGLDVTISGQADAFVSNHRLKNITPVTLLPGSYVIVAKGYNANELNGNGGLGSPLISGDNASGAISYTGTGLYGNEGAGFSYPQNADGPPANRYLAGTFSFSTDSSATTPAPAFHQAYTTSTSTGVQAYGGELGMQFSVTTSVGITIRQLGTFDHNANGISGTQNGGIRVAIFNADTRQIVAGLDATISGMADTLVAGHRLKNITPVSLPAGNYTIVAKGYNMNELNGNVGLGSPAVEGDNAGGAIAYSGTGLYGSEGAGFSYPQNPDGGPAKRYLAGTFTYTVGSGSNSVTAASPLAGSRLNGSRVATLISSLSAAAAGTTHQAYSTSTTTGVQNYGGELGMEFRVNNPAGISISQLGTFDHQANGINGSIRVAVFNKATRTIVSGLDATITGQGDAYNGNHRLKNITPVTLLPGDYAVVVKGYNAGELNGNAGFGTPPAGTDDAGGAISYMGGGLYGSEGAGFSYPLNSDGGPATRYLAGTFVYSVMENSGGKTVTITASDKKGNTATATAQVTVKDTLGACRGAAAPAIQQASATVDVESGSAIRLYPNPARDRFTVQLSGMRGTKGMIEVLDINGRVLEQRVVSFAGKAGSQTQVFNLSAQPSGVYFVRVKSDEATKTLKVVVAR